MENCYLIFVLVISIIYCRVAESQRFQVMQYVLQWPPTFCRTHRCIANVSEEYSFTIHGLWPADSSGKGISCTCPRPLMEDLKVDTIMNSKPALRNRLREIWPNLEDKVGCTDDSFWRYEWRTHGYCTRYALNATQYFEAAVAVDDMFPLKSMYNVNLINYLKDGGITPSNHTGYAMRDIRRSISVLVGARTDVYISCYVNSTGHALIQEIHLCLDPRVNNFLSCPKLQHWMCESKDTRIFLPA